ncbi:MAG: LysM peptidoglycan-binding domain-containing protein [Acetatifactor sp.]|nr:LysM peptidoglycan-binding domain-containing protein [Acetatifactor sp.]
MRTQRNQYEMNEREAKRYARMLRLQRERRRKCLSAFIALLAAVGMILICSVSYGSINSSANDGFKYYTSVTVEAGESLWVLAEEYVDGVHYDSRESYIAEVCSINHLADENAITAGQMLILPYYSQEYVR